MKTIQIDKSLLTPTHLHTYKEWLMENKSVWTHYKKMDGGIMGLVMDDESATAFKLKFGL